MRRAPHGEDTEVVRPSTIHLLLCCVVGGLGCGDDAVHVDASFGDVRDDVASDAPDLDDSGADAGVESPDPASLPYYELERLRNLTLDELDVEELARETIDGVTVVAVAFSAFTQPLADGAGRTIDVRWRQRGVLCLPPVDDASAVRQAAAYNVHDADPFAAMPARHWCVQGSTAFGVPVFMHGWEPDVLHEIAGESFHGTQALLLERLLAAEIEDPGDLHWDGRFLFDGFVLAKGDVVALTALQRLVEREWGADVDELASLGISKEGHAHWLLGALDDRVRVLAPGGSYLQDIGAIHARWRADWNCALPGDADSALFRTVFRWADWLLNTEAGRRVDQLLSPSHWWPRIHARHVLVSGDLGLHGIYGTSPNQHDWAYPLLAERSFFEAFEHPSWRYVRAVDGSGVSFDEGVGELGLGVFPQVLELLTDDVTSPSVPVVETMLSGRTVEVVASADFDLVASSTDVSPGPLVLLYATSMERSLRTTESEWRTVELEARGDGSFATSVDIPDGEGLTFMVLATERVRRGAFEYLRSASSLPQEMLPVAEHACVMPSWR